MCLSAGNLVNQADIHDYGGYEKHSIGSREKRRAT